MYSIWDCLLVKFRFYFFNFNCSFKLKAKLNLFVLFINARQTYCFLLVNVMDFAKKQYLRFSHVKAIMRYNPVLEITLKKTYQLKVHPGLRQSGIAWLSSYTVTPEERKDLGLVSQDGSLNIKINSIETYILHMI